MEWNNNSTAQKLFKSFMQFHKVDWQAKSVEGYKPSEVRILFCLRNSAKPEGSDMTVSEISKLLHVTSPTVTQLVTSLEANGLVERNMDQTDRRSVRVRITEQGERVMEKAAKAFSNFFNGLIEYLGEEQSNQLAALLSKVFIYFNEKDVNWDTDNLRGADEA